MSHVLFQPYRTSQSSSVSNFRSDRGEDLQQQQKDGGDGAMEMRRIYINANDETTHRATQAVSQKRIPNKLVLLHTLCISDAGSGSSRQCAASNHQNHRLEDR